ncbi:hypothetical protein BC941DRAFT_410175 [Chlamydoabsidia padenii]|nr:hypothetical protein BC941DRAFT_410175 [Chlamydoabsidia padenii]
MLDKVISRLKEEVAMDGYKGTSISDLWALVKRFLGDEINNHKHNNSTTIIEPVVDLAYKKFFWRQFRSVSNLSFFNNDQLEIVEQQLKDSGAGEEEKDDIELDYNFIQGITLMEYDQVEEQYGDNLRVVADKTLQEAQLFVGVPVGNTLSKNLRNYLTSILQTRERGITQADLTKLWNVDARSSGHFVKSLEQKGAIYRSNVVCDATRTNLCKHVRFKNYDSVVGPSDDMKCANINFMGVVYSQEVYRNRLIDLLKDAKDNMMFSTDILTAMGFDLSDTKVRKWFNRSLDSVVHQGLVRKLIATVSTGRPQRCVELLNNPSKPSSSALIGDSDPGTSDINFGDLGHCILKAKNKQSDKQMFMHGASLEYQILRIIQSSGIKGVTHKDIATALRCDNTRLTGRALDKLCEIKGDERLKYGVEKGLEFEGRNRRYRYYAYATYLEMTTSTTVDIPDIKTFTFDESKLEEVDYRKIVPRKSFSNTSSTSCAQSNEPPKRRGRPPKKANELSRPRKRPLKNQSLPVETPDQTLSSVEQLPPPSADTFTTSLTTTTTVSPTVSPTSTITALPTVPTTPTTTALPTTTTTNVLQQNVDEALPSHSPPATASATCLIDTPIDHSSPTQTQIDIATNSDMIQPSGVMKRMPSDNVTEATAKKQRVKPAHGTITGYFKVMPRQEKQITRSDAASLSSSTTEAVPSTEAVSTAGATTSTEAVSTAEAAVSTEAVSTEALSTAEAAASTEALSTAEAADVTLEMAPGISAPSSTATASQNDTPPTSKFLFKKKPAQINNYLEQRKQILLAILEDTTIIEKGVGLKRLYGDKYVELFGDDTSSRTHKIDTKTLWRSALALVKEGLVHIREGQVLLLNGNRTKKEVLINKSLDPNGPEVNSYFELLTDRKVLQPYNLKLEPIKKTELAVESLDDRLDRMQESKEQAKANGNMVEAKRLESEIQAIKNSAARSNETTQQLKQSNWLMVGLQFGFIAPRMIRAKLFHQYLLELLLSDTAVADGVDIQTRTIPTTAMIMNMTLGLSCKLVGVFSPTEEFSDLMQDEASENIKLGDLSDSIRGCVFHARNHFRRKIRWLLDCLIILGLVENVEPQTPNVKGAVTKVDSFAAPSNLGFKYRLTTETTILNYRLPDHPPLHKHSLMDQDSLLAYWSDLEYCYLRTDLTEDESEIPVVTENDNGDWIRALYTIKNWTQINIFTRQQREILNKYVDRDLRTTPLSNLLLCKSIAAEVGASNYSVTNYFKKMEEAMDPDFKPIKRNKQRPKGQRRVPRSRFRTLGATGIVSKPFKYKGFKTMTVDKLVAAQQQGGDEHLDGRDDDSRVPTITQAELSSKLIKSRSKRRVWSMEEDDLLKLCHVIVDHRKEHGHRFRWQPISDLIGRFKINACRNRLLTIREQPKHAEDMQSIRIRWNWFYDKGVRDGTFASWKYVDDDHFDLVYYVTYYLQQCQLDDVQFYQDGHIPLPATCDIIQENYSINSMASLKSQEDDFFEDEYHQKVSGVAKRYALYLHSFTLRTNKPDSYDNLSSNHQDLDVTRRTIALLMQFFKMVLFTPGDLYDPYYAYAFMNSFPKDVINAALDYGRKKGILLHPKGDRIFDRRLPKTRLGISERFMRHMTMELPENIWLQAHEFEKDLAATPNTLLDPVNLDESRMLCLLDAHSAGKLSIDINNVDEFYERFNGPHHASRQLEESNQNYDMSLTILEPRDTPCTNIVMEQDIKRLTESQLESTLDKLCQDNPMATLLQSLVTYLTSRGNDGANLVEVKQALVDSMDDLPDSLLMSAVEAITTKAAPPLAVFVGFGDSRLVLATKLDMWTIQPFLVDLPPAIEGVSKRRRVYYHHKNDADGSDQGGTDHGESLDSATPAATNGDTTIIKRKRPNDFLAVTSQHQEELKQRRKQVIKPLMWNDINGDILNPIWKGCLDLVVEALIRRPGVTFGHLCRVLSATLLPIEVADLLKHLLQWGALRQVSVSTGTSGLFKSNQRLCTVPSFAIDPSKQTSYWLVPGFYNHLPRLG